MNISSIVISAQPQKLDALVAEIKNSTICEYQLHDDKGRIIVTIEGDNVEHEIEKLKKLQKMPNVIDAVMSFSYTEDELEEKKDKLERMDKIPDWLNDPKAELKDIKYNGDLKGMY